MNLSKHYSYCDTREILVTHHALGVRLVCRCGEVLGEVKTYRHSCDYCHKNIEYEHSLFTTFTHAIRVRFWEGHAK